MTQTNEAAFETVIKTHLLANGYVTMNRDGFDREWGIFSETALAFIRATQPKEWVNRDARRQTECTIVLVKERRTVLIAAAVTGRITIRESMEDTLHGKCGGNMRC